MNQKVIAGRMGMSESKFSRWVNKKSLTPASVTALDGLQRFLDDLRSETEWNPAALSAEDLERIETEIGLMEVEQNVARAVKKRAKKKPLGKGKKLATR